VQFLSRQIGSYSAKIPAGSFTQQVKHSGRFQFKGEINGVSLEFRFVPVGNNMFTFVGKGSGIDLSGLTSPVPVVLTIGIDRGSTLVATPKS
jgi:hypothetical protein